MEEEYKTRTGPRDVGAPVRLITWYILKTIFFIYFFLLIKTEDIASLIGWHLGKLPGWLAP
jgi:hypothetical protein